MQNRVIDVLSNYSNLNIILFMKQAPKQFKSVRLTKQQMKSIKLSSIKDEINESAVIRKALNQYFKN